MKDGDKLLQQLREAAKERDKRYLEYLLVCPTWDVTLECLVPYRIDGSEETLNWN